MDEMTTALEQARRTVDPAWDAARTRRAREAFRARLERRRRVRIATFVGLPVAAAITLVAYLAMPDGSERRQASATARPPATTSVHATTRAASRPFRFWDGSTATPVGDGALRASEVTPSRIVIDVERGGGHFEVTPGLRERAFVVRTRGVSVHVVGTEFTVGAEGERTRVSVDHGRVLVQWTGGEATLADGDSGVFPPGVGAIEAPAPEAAAPEPEPSRERSDRTWRRLAESGDFGGAFEAMSAAEVRDRPEELLLAADAARLSGHPREALPYYQRVVRDHGDDPRAPLAAFTMGRVLLTQLGRPRDAASAFARARSLAGGGSIAEDALAREVEARSNAGETERARALAEEYVTRYPAGQRLRAVRRFGGLP